MFIAVPNHQSLDAQTYGQYWAGYDVPRHLWHFTAKTMCLLLERHGLKLITTLPMKLDAYYVSLLSEKYKAGNHKISGISRAVVRAWKSNIAATKTREFSSLIFIVQK
jgi:hypothetical protein